MKKIYPLLASILICMAIAVTIHRLWFQSNTDQHTELQETQEPNTTATFNTISPSPTEHKHRKDSDSSQSLKIEAIDPNQTVELAKLQNFANDRLELLDRELALNSMQKKRIYQLIMVYSAPKDLQLQMGGQTVQAPEKSMEDAILDELDDDRRRIYQQSLIDHASWWDNAIEQMEQSIAEDALTEVSETNETP